MLFFFSNIIKTLDTYTVKEDKPVIELVKISLEW